VYSKGKRQKGKVKQLPLQATRGERFFVEKKVERVLELLGEEGNKLKKND